MYLVGVKNNPSSFLSLKLGIDPGLPFLCTQIAIEINLNMTI
jgi:hypothetical protein